MDAANFAKAAQYLTHPLVLVGFVLMLVFGVHRQLLKSGILPRLNQKEGSKLARLVLHYGFWLGLAVVVLGICLKVFQDWHNINTSGE